MRLFMLSLLVIACFVGCTSNPEPQSFLCPAGSVCIENSTHAVECPPGTERKELTSTRVKCVEEQVNKEGVNTSKEANDTKGEDNKEETYTGENVENESEEEMKMSQLPNRYAVIETNMGTMKIELYEQRAPITTKNFIDLANKGFYNNLTVHRVIPDFMIQGGCPEGTGTGGPGYTIQDEFHPELKHDSKGILSMANAGPNTGGSQFFITLKDTPWLDNHHSVFGKVVEGMDVLDAIGKVKTGANDKPVETVSMNKVSIVEV